MPAHVSKEYRIYLALWRKAYIGAEPVIVKAANYSLAMSMRQGMYRAIKTFREGSGGDYELTKAAEKYVIYLVKGEVKSDPHFLEFRERKTLAALELSWDSLGLEETDLLIGEEREISEKLTKMLDGVDAPKRKTKYFERG